MRQSGESSAAPGKTTEQPEAIAVEPCETKDLDAYHYFVDFVDFVAFVPAASGASQL